MKHTDSTDRGMLDLASMIEGKPDPDVLRDLLRDVIDPEVGINIVDLGLVYEVGLSSDGIAQIRMTLTTPGCPLGGYITDSINDTLAGVPGVKDTDVQIIWEPPWDPDAMMSDWAKDQLGWSR
ncbi:MAG: metal-sulfur cluster assembly factor [Trebonia sp.]